LGSSRKMHRPASRLCSVGDPQAGDSGSGGRDDRVVDGGEGAGAVGWVVADSSDVE
jgi:hypothetical protein